MPRKSREPEIQADPTVTRTKAWGDYFEQLLIDHNYQTRTLLASRADIARFTGLSAVTIGDWLNRKAVPSRRTSTLIALKFQRPLLEVLTSAGYPPNDEERYATLESVISTVETADLREKERASLVDALRVAMSPRFMTSVDAEEWRVMVVHLLNQSFTPLSKAKKIAAIVDLWRAEAGVSA